MTTRDSEGRVERVAVGNTELVRLRVGDARMDIAPGLGCCVVSWVVDGMERLALPLPLEAFAASQKTGGIPLLYPFANRLRADRFVWNGTTCELSSVPGLKRDGNGLPIHGFLVRFGQWSSIGTSAPQANSAWMTAVLAWDESLEAMFTAFPFPHRLLLSFELAPRAIRIKTRVEPRSCAMPVAFGWHPYFALPTAQRAATLLQLPARSHVELDRYLLPRREGTQLLLDGDSTDEALTLNGRTFDDLYVVREDAQCALRPPSGGATLGFERGYRFLQVYAPADAGFACLEPMVAAGAALSDNQAIEAAPDRPFEAVFAVHAC